MTKHARSGNLCHAKFDLLYEDFSNFLLKYTYLGVLSQFQITTCLTNRAAQSPEQCNANDTNSRAVGRKRVVRCAEFVRGENVPAMSSFEMSFKVSMLAEQR